MTIRLPPKSSSLSYPESSDELRCARLSVDTVPILAEDRPPSLPLMPSVCGDGGRAPQSKLRLLTFTTLFPNDQQPNHGIFVENRLRHLVESGQVESTVVAPVPYFPSWAPCFGQWSRYARVAQCETRHGVIVHHPRFPVIPLIGMVMSPALLATATIGLIRRLHAQIGFDAIDAHYVYPDGVAAAWIGKRLRLPVVATARGTDVNLIPRYRIPRRLIQRAIGQAAGLIAVSTALKHALVDLGARPEQVVVLRNGVDLEQFHPLDRQEARRALGLTRPTLLSVGHLIERKGHHRVIKAMCQLPEFDLLIVGEGEECTHLEQLAQSLGVAHRVRLLGAVGHREIARIYSAADTLVLASSREGWANVLLEAMACGTPVVASNIWGNPEVVASADAGLLMKENSAEGIVVAVRSLFASPPDRDAVCAYAEAFSWDDTTEGQLTLFRSVIARATGKFVRYAH